MTVRDSSELASGQSDTEREKIVFANTQERKCEDYNEFQLTYNPH